MLFLYLLIIVCAYVVGYIVSLYALAVYIDPDEVHTLLPRISRHRRERLEKLAGDPRAFSQVAAIYRSLALIVITVSFSLLMDRVLSGTGSDPLVLYPLGFLLVWIIYILVMEYLPRRSSRRAINQKMLRNLWLISGIYTLLSPIVRLYRRGLERVKPEDRVTEQEKEEIVERAIETLAEQAGIGEALVEEDEKEMIGQIFLLDQTQVREIMSPRIDIEGIEKSASFTQIQDLVRTDGHSRYPVYEESIDKITGVLYVKDIFSNMPAQGEEFVISNYLRKPYFVPESKVIGELLREFRAKKLHIAIAIDEYGGVAGLVTLEDILEEIVGEIQDEHDSEAAEIRPLQDGYFEVDASLRIEKLQDFLETEYNQEEHDTVGGLIYDIVGSVPEERTSVKWHDIVFDVLSVDGQRIKVVRIHRKGR